MIRNEDKNGSTAEHRAEPAIASESARVNVSDPAPARYPRPAVSPRAYDVLLGTAARLTDLLLLTVAAAPIAQPSPVAQTMQDPASFWTVQFSIQNIVELAICCMFWAAVLHAVGLYQASHIRSRRDLLFRLYTGVGICATVTPLLLRMRNSDQGLARSLVTFFLLGFLQMAVVRAFLLGVDRWVRPHLRQVRRAIIVGTDARSADLARKLARDRAFRYELVGYVEAAPSPTELFAGRPVLGTIDDMEHLLMREHVDEVLVALPVQTHYEEIRQVLQFCEASGVRSQYFSDLFETSVTKRREAEGDNAERVVLHMVHSDMRQAVKRAVDVTGAVVGLVVLSPLFLLIALAIKLSSPGPVFFAQTRYGLNKRLFPMFKFRSMVPDAEQLQGRLEHLNETGGPVFKIKDDPRITPIGRMLRRTSLDEFPQLLNVLRGEMSLVGPRPLPMRDVGNFSELSLVRRFSVKPGMTGLWQVSGRSNTTFDGWVKLDLYYIDQWSLLLDVRILLQTLPAVLRGSGAS